MPRRFVVGGRSNTPSGQISAHRFPKAEKLRKIWIKFVNTTRDFVCTQSSVVCSDHFTQECFERSFVHKQQFELGTRGRALIKCKYPTVRPKPIIKQSKTSVSPSVTLGTAIDGCHCQALTGRNLNIWLHFNICICHTHARE